MKIVLLSGGSGKRLWPLSNDSRSKQFLKVLNGKNDLPHSMVQRVWKQIENVNLAHDTVIATSKSQVDMIKSQIESDVEVIIEPTRRDTFPAIALAAAYLHSEKKCDLSEVISILPVDPFVDDNFFNKVSELENVLNDYQCDLALIGVEPTSPSSKFGYIIPGLSKKEGINTVNSFQEKPSKEVAKGLISNGALWNCGVFAFKLGYIIELIKDLGFSTDFTKLREQYSDLPKISFDYAVVEKANNIYVTKYSGYWKDLGTWNTLTSEMKKKINGKGILDEEVTNTHIVNELDIPITVIGIDNAIVAASPDGILVSDKNKSQLIKNYLSGLEERPMYEERRWGWYRVLDYVKYEEGNEVLTKRIGIKAGKNLSYQMHHQRSEIWSVVKGEGILILDDEYKHVRPGDVVNIPLSCKHAIKAISNMEIVEVQTGSELVEEDIIRIAVDWNEIEKIALNKVY